MKRSALLLLAPMALMAGCQTIKAHNPFRHKAPDYQSAQQVRPLEVPPGINRPPTSEALTIPDAGNAGAMSQAGGAEASAPPAAGIAATQPPAAVKGDSLTLNDTPESVYRRVGLALQRGDVGNVIAHDDAAHTYQVAVDTEVTKKPEGGFFHRLFHRSHAETVTGNVNVSIAPQGNGSLVKAEGNADAVARVLALIQQRLQ